MIDRPKPAYILVAIAAAFAFGFDTAVAKASYTGKITRTFCASAGLSTAQLDVIEPGWCWMKNISPTAVGGITQFIPVEVYSDTPIYGTARLKASSAIAACLYIKTFLSDGVLLGSTSTCSTGATLVDQTLSTPNLTVPAGGAVELIVVSHPGVTIYRTSVVYTVIGL